MEPSAHARIALTWTPEGRRKACDYSGWKVRSVETTKGSRNTAVHKRQLGISSRTIDTQWIFPIKAQKENILGRRIRKALEIKADTSSNDLRGHFACHDFHHPKASLKRFQHFHSTTFNIIGFIMLNTFDNPIISGVINTVAFVWPARETLYNT